MRNDANTTCDNEKKCKKKTSKDSKNMIKTQIITPLYSTAARLERKTLNDLSSSQITYSKKLPKQDIFSKKMGYAFLLNFGRSEIINHTDYPSGKTDNSSLDKI